MPHILVVSDGLLFQGSESGGPCVPGCFPGLCRGEGLVLCARSPEPSASGWGRRPQAPAHPQSLLCNPAYVTEPTEPKLKEETILLPLDSPNPYLSLPWALRSPPKVLSAFQISNFVCLCNQKYDGRVSRG